MRLSPVVSVTATLCACLVTANGLYAAPPAGVVAATTPPSNEWIEHEVIPGERLLDVANRYAVSTQSLTRWNQLRVRRASDFTGQRLRIQTRLPFRQRSKVQHVVRQSDTWTKIAQRYRVDSSALQHMWNADATLVPGERVLVWVEPDTTILEDDQLPSLTDITVPVPIGAQSVGYPTAGRLLDGALIPENPALYTLRNTKHAYGSSHAISVLQQGLAEFRLNTQYAGEIQILDMSLRRGGYFTPHKSHRTGRDVEIAMPLKAGLPLDTPPDNDAVDWQATWQLVRSFIDTGKVKYIFLGRARQQHLFATAKANNVSREELERVIQFPRFTKHGIVRHSPGHTCHLHVRFACGPDEPRCKGD
jgi:murein endopeptidase/LysM repeat protein